MRRYEPSIPRVASAAAALAMTVISLGLLVVYPAEMDAFDGAGDWSASDVLTMASAGVVGGEVSDDADAVGKPATAATQCTEVKTDGAPKS
ncbi:MAG TPA: hypothetical protein VF420_16845 [Casimicrobiaceae bacterium]